MAFTGGMSEDEQMAFAMRESMKSITSEPNPPPYYHQYPSDGSEHYNDGDADLMKAFRESLTLNQGKTKT